MGVEVKAKSYGAELSSSILQKQAYITSFGELYTVHENNVINIKPTFGFSNLRDRKILSGSGAIISSSYGELGVSTGVTQNSSAKLRSLERGQYIAGTVANVGLGVRIPENIADDQEIRWGYFDDDNGFGFGTDITGTYIFCERNSSIDKVYQSDWNIDKADGTPGSKFNLNLSHGYVYKIDFVWYGYGSAEFSILAPINGRKEKVRIHDYSITGSTIITDPNQPISISASNGSTTTDVKAFVGGRHYSVYAHDTNLDTRNVPEYISDYTITANENVWEPIISIREKEIFRGRKNSIRGVFNNLKVISDNAAELLITFGGTTSGGTWNNPSGFPENESGFETKAATSGTFTGLTTGIPIARDIIGTEKNVVSESTFNQKIIISGNSELIVWCRKTTANATVISAVLSWDEQW